MFILYSLITIIIINILSVWILKYIPIKYTPLMLKRKYQHRKDKNFKINHEWVSFNDIPDVVITAIMLSEDPRFIVHHGVRWDLIKKELRNHKKGTRWIGWSTISQQTAKNIFTFCTRTWTRKLIELYWTMLIELIWGKKRILEIYLNSIEMGPGIFGIKAASKYHFNSDVKELNIENSAILAKILPSPIKRNVSYIKSAGKSLIMTLQDKIIRNLPIVIKTFRS